MYANGPHPTAAASHLPPLTPQQQPGVALGAPGMPTQHAPASFPTTPTATAIGTPVAVVQASPNTGAYQPTGDAAVDRMIRLEAACKRFGSLI